MQEHFFWATRFFSLSCPMHESFFLYFALPSPITFLKVHPLLNSIIEDEELQAEPI